MKMKNFVKKSWRIPDVANTSIEWTATVLPDGQVLPGYSFNPWVGCEDVSAGCQFCYARDLVERWGGDFSERRHTSNDYWRQPSKWNRLAESTGIRRRVFPSMCDPFDNRVPIDWFIELLVLILHTPWLDWILLTKRPQLITRRFAAAREIATGLPPLPWRNIWLGTTAETQEEAESRIPYILDVPAVVRLISVEPALGLVDPTVLRVPEFGWLDALRGEYWSGGVMRPAPGRLHWVIWGGESGSRKNRPVRPYNPVWEALLRAQCGDAGVPYFRKQWGDWAPAFRFVGDTFPAELAIGRRELSVFFDTGHAVELVGKKRAGALLDGVHHRSCPQ